MDEANYTEPAHPQEGRRARRRQLVQTAIALAAQSRWQEAAQVNHDIVTMAPDDAEAYNRLGKAHTELGQVTQAREAYQQSLRADPANLIAQRNLDRLSRITDAEAAELAAKAGQKLDPRFFMEETGKTGVTVLQDVGENEVLATLTAGDQITLGQDDGTLVVSSPAGAYIGRVEELLGSRLVRLMQSGNQYQAGIVGVDEKTVRIIIRETFQAPENVGRISFPPRTTAESLPRPYVREGLLRRGNEDLEDEDEPDVDISEVDNDDDDEDTSEFGTHEISLDES
jgi:tetratricopeptide (TPR) repeat protein